MPETLADRIHVLVTAPGTKDLVTTFYEEGGPFAGSLFDTLGSNPNSQIVTDDLLAVSLLDVGFKPRAVRALLLQGEPDGAMGSLLEEVPGDRRESRCEWQGVCDLDGCRAPTVRVP